MRLIIPLLFMLMGTVALAESKLKPFTTDGCSSFPDGTIEDKELWLDCCTQHDLAYWKGGTYLQRQTADESLNICVEEAGEPEIAKLMLAGVRVGGTPYLPTKFWWGYRWPYPRGYRALSEREKAQVAERLNLSEQK